MPFFRSDGGALAAEAGVATQRRDLGRAKMGGSRKAMEMAMAMAMAMTIVPRGPR